MSGVVPDGWDIDDHLVAFSHRVSRLKVFGVELFTGAVRAFKVLWPSEADPKNP